MSTEETIDTFVKQNYDLSHAFTAWYADRHAADPEGFPLKLSRAEWLETFACYIESLIVEGGA